MHEDRIDKGEIVPQLSSRLFCLSRLIGIFIVHTHYTHFITYCLENFDGSNIGMSECVRRIINIVVVHLSYYWLHAKENIKKFITNNNK